MKNKLILFVSLLILILSITTVSAAELNDTDVDSQNNDLISINSDDAVLNESNLNDEKQISFSKSDDVLSSIDSKITLKARDYTGSSFKVLKGERIYFDVTSSPALTSDDYYYKIFVNNNKINTNYYFDNDGVSSFSLSKSTLEDYTIFVRVYSSGTVDSNKLTMSVVDALKNDTTLMLSSRDYSTSSFSVAKGDKLYFDVTSNPPIKDDGAYYRILFNGVESDNSFTFGSDGKGAFSWTPSSIKTYTLRVVSYNSSAYYNAVSNTLTVNVLEKTTISLMANESSVEYGDIVKFTPTVYGSNNNEITSGNVTYYIDGKTWITTPVNRNLQGTMNLGGIHNISVKYLGYGSYAPSNFAYVMLTVGKLQADLNITVTTVNYPNNPVLTIKTNVDGNYNIKVADLIDEHVEISNGFCEFILTDLNIGDYEAQVIFEGDDDYDSTTESIFFSVLRQIPGFNLNSVPDTINHGESVKLKSFTDNNQATGTVDYYVDGIYNVTSDLMEEITLTGFDYGLHSIFANYSGDNNFLNDSKTITFTVLDERSDLNFIVNSNPVSAEINYGDTLILTPFASVSDVGGSFDFYVDGVYNTSRTFGNSVTFSSLSIGSHIITVNYTGDSNYATSTYSINCNVVDSRKNPNFTIISNLNEDNTIEYGEDLKLTSLTETLDATGCVDYYLDDKSKLSSNIGENILISDLEYGLHTISAVYSGDSNYKNASESISFTVTAALIKTNVELLINNSKETIIRINPLESLNFTNIITPVPGNVRIRLYESNSDTGINGWYANTWLFKRFYDEGIYRYTAVFEGNNEYARSASNEITVIVGNPDSLNATSMKITCRPVLKPQSTIFHVGEKLRITASILKGDGTSLLGVGNITVYDNGNYYTFNDLESAGSRDLIIYLTYNNVGTHNISVYFSGSENYSGCSGWIQFEIVKYDVNLSITVRDVDYPSHITANIISDVPGSYSIVISNKTYNIVLTENELSKSLEIEDILDADDYEAIVKISESDLHNSKSVLCKFKVFKSNSSQFSITTEKESNPTIVIHTSLDGYATGTVTFYENNSDLAIGNCSLGESWTYDKLEEGYHTLIAKYSGDKNHESAIRNVTVFIDEIFRFKNTTLTLEINNVHIKAGDIIRITPVVLDDKNMRVNEGDVTFYDENDNILATNILELTAMKNITIKARYNGIADKYNSSYFSINLIVYLNDANVEFIIDDVSYPTTPVAIIITNAKGNYSIKLLNKTYSFEINDENNKLVVLDSIPVGNYTAILTYDGNEFYNKKEVSAEFKVNKSEINVFNIIITPTTAIYGNSIILTSTLGVDDAKGNVTYSDGENIIGIKNIGEALIINDLDSGEYDILAIYDGDDKYNPAVTSVHVSVLKANITLSISVDDVKHSDSAVLHVNANLDDLYNITLGDKKLTVKVGDGKGIVELPLLDVGSYNITVYHNGNRNYNSTNATYEFNVASSSFNFEITSDSYNINYGEYVTLTPKLPKDARGIVTFIDSNNNVLGTISANETFKTNKLNTGDNIITALYSDDVNYNNANVKININVNKLNTTIITSKTTLNLVVGDTVKIDAYLNPNNAGYIIYKSNDESVVRITSDAQLTAIGEGSTSIIISFTGNEIYNPSEAKVNVIVSSKEVPIIKKDVNMSISSFVQSNNATITVTLDDDASGIVNILNQKSLVNNGKATVYLHDLPGGSLVLPVTYSGDDKYNYIEDNLTIVVKTVIPKENITLDVNAPEINEGMDAVITVSLAGDASGNISISNQSALVVGGKAVITISDLHEGNHILPVSYSGDEKYNPCITNVTVHVNPIKKSEINIDAQNVIKFYGGSERFRVKLTDLEGNPIPNKQVEINISGRQYNKITNANGTVTAPLGLNSGNYTVVVNVNGTVAMANVIILPTVRGNDVFKVFRNASQYIATFTDSQGNYLAEGTSVEFNINGVLYMRNVRSNGAARLNLNLEQGTYVITAFNSVTGERCTNNIIIISRIIENRDITKYFKNSTQYTVKVLGDDGNPVGKGVNVTFNINGLFYNRATNNNGVAKLNINLQPGNYVITAEYGGCKVSNNIKVLPVLSAENLSMKFNDGSQFKVKLVDGQGNSLSNATVGFNINGVFYTRTTNSEGIARLNIKLQSGEYIITSSYNGANIANKITIS